jgi:hypothetical protein
MRDRELRKMPPLPGSILGAAEADVAAAAVGFAFAASTDEVASTVLIGA